MTDYTPTNVRMARVHRFHDAVCVHLARADMKGAAYVSAPMAAALADVLREASDDVANWSFSAGHFKTTCIAPDGQRWQEGHETPPGFVP